MGRVLPLEVITPEAFAEFGTVIDWTPELQAANRRFSVAMKSEDPTGWRLGVLHLVEREMPRMECHPTTWELFAPIAGQGVIVVHKPGAFDEGAIRAFLLHSPVCLYAGTWHDMFTLSPECTVLIGENLAVTGERAVLSQPITATLG